MNAKWMSLVAALGIFAASAAVGATPHVVNVPGYPTSAAQPIVCSTDLPAGTLIRAELQTTISSRDAQPGTPFFATVRAPIMDAKGTIVIPAGTQIAGRVRDVHRRGLFGHTRLAVSIEGFRMSDRFVPVSANLMQYDVTRHRTGLLRSEQTLLPGGSPVIVELTRPVPVALLMPPATHAAIGGGPQAHVHKGFALHGRPYTPMTPKPFF